MAKKKMNFYVSARINVVTNIDIKADSWDDALAQAKELKLQDFVTLAGDYIDGDGVTLDTIWERGDK